MKKFFLPIIFIILFCFVPTACGTGYVAMQVLNGDYSKFEKSKILEILSKETLLFYSDGVSQLGSLFGQEHRIYVSIDKIPQVVKDAIVSAEDEDFYTNIGIDIKGIFRAAIHNLFFSTRQGASTITQQTVKNLYGRKETDLLTKFEEMINAFKLERLYSKDQILEFYLNQFHVTGNGRGVGVAAKYYFNKDVEDLNLIEAAFIAASVKGPEKYNPFTKITISGQERAKREAFFRKNYVIERMLKNKKITKQQYNDAIKMNVPFNQGRFQYNELSVNQIVMKQLGRTEVLQAIGASSVDEIGTMGLHITTTLEKSVQSAAQYGLRQNLSRMQMILKGFDPEPQANFFNIQKPELYNFYVGRVDNINTIENNESIRINFGVPTCFVNTEGINRVAINTDQTMRRGLQKSKEFFLKSLLPGQYILASIKKISQDGSLLCDIETRPKVQGASLVLDKGKIVAMAGGFSSNEYNRALFAERQPGSTFKLPTYYAALQMGWSVLDSLPNVRDVFTWQGNLYFPRPDHIPNSLETTILGAGAKSENLASVWLLAHMLDKINYNQFEDLLKFLGIMKEGAGKSQALSIIANKFNATPDNLAYIRQGVLNKIKNDLTTDISVLNNNSLKLFIRTLHDDALLENQEHLILADKSLTDKEQAIRLNILKNNLPRWNILAEKAQRALATLIKITQEKEAITESDREILAGFARINNNSEVLAYHSLNPWQPQISSHLVQKVDMLPTNIDNLLTLTRNNSALLNHSNILLDGVVPLAMIESINQHLISLLQEIEHKDALERLFWNEDFRYSLSMYYTASMVNSMGVNKPLQWVPSFPLGSNVVTLAELALVYQTFLTGKTYRYFNNQQANQLIVIKRIEDSSGNLLWEPVVNEYKFTDPFYSIPILNTLRGTVTAGTAYPLNWNIILRSDNEDLDVKLKTEKIRVPVFGKTGTTNNYTNGTYIGFLPYPLYKGNSLSPENAYTIASYIGYDSNEPMVRKWYRAYGGVAIPAWEEIALNIIKSQNYADKLNWEEISEAKTHVAPFNYGPGLTQIVVPLNSGISLSAQEAEPDQENEENDIYANDYSDTGKHLFKVYLDGSISDDIFIPKRRISFYDPFNYATDNNAFTKFSEENLNKEKKLNDMAPLQNQQKDNSGVPVTNKNNYEDLPPPPPILKK